jgi:beta-1,4-mannosyl-glycoprotein beta-1,4-N-acetylglucosaminyltransferase
MIYDCIIFNNELDVLDIRLHELDSVVDKFVIVESTVTHVNRPKKLFYESNKERFKKFHKKIIHVIVKDTPNVNLAWIINDFQFSQMMRGLKNCKPDDIILFGDADEIPSAEMVKKWKNKPGKHKLFLQRLSYYYLNYSVYNQKSLNGTHMIKYKDLVKLGTMWIAKYSPIDVEITHGGWHFSYLTDVAGIQKKMESMAHQEYNNEKYNTPEKIKKAILFGKDLLGKNSKFKRVDITTLPLYVQQNPGKFKKFLLHDDLTKDFYKIFIGFYLDIKDFLRILVRNLRRRYGTIGN